jgi:putative transposase
MIFCPARSVASAMRAQSDDRPDAPAVDRASGATARPVALVAVLPVAADLGCRFALMRRIDELHLEHPFAGRRMLRDLLRREGFEVGRKHVTTLMRKMGIEALYQKPRTSRRHREHPVFPYLLRGMAIERPNQVWAMDTTYIPMRRGFVYLTAVVDWASRRVLAFRVSISLAADAAVDALKEAIARYGVPQIMNTDQGSQFTATEFIDVLREHDIRISMVGKGCWRDNVFVERLWKTIKYEHVYLHAYESVSEAQTKIASYLEFYNRHPHSRLDRSAPDDAYFSSQPLEQAA